MRNAIPFISAHAAELRQRLRHAQDGHKKPRLQMLYGLASGPAHTRQEVAPRLGVHRHTIGRWLALYAAGGLHTLLATDVPAGKPVSLAPAVLASLEQALRRPEGLESGCRASSHPPTPDPCGYAARLKAALASSPCADVG